MILFKCVQAAVHNEISLYNVSSVMARILLYYCHQECLTREREEIWGYMYMYS